MSRLTATAHPRDPDLAEPGDDAWAGEVLIAPAAFEASLKSPEQRGAARFKLLLRVAKLRTAAGEFLCVLRDISNNGLKVRIFHPIPKNELCELELGGGEVLRVKRVWQHSGYAGFRFTDSPIEVDRLIEEAGPFPKRHIRLRLSRPVPLMLVADGLSLPALLRDISQHGAALTLDQRLAIGQQVRIVAPQLPALNARVRWRRGSLHGLVFQEGFQLDALAQLVAAMQLIPHPDDNPHGSGSSGCGISQV